MADLNGFIDNAEVYSVTPTGTFDTYSDINFIDDTQIFDVQAILDVESSVDFIDNGLVSGVEVIHVLNASSVINNGVVFDVQGILNQTSNVDVINNGFLYPVTTSSVFVGTVPFINNGSVFNVQNVGPAQTGNVGFIDGSFVFSVDADLSNEPSLGVYNAGFSGELGNFSITGSAAYTPDSNILLQPKPSTKLKSILIYDIFPDYIESADALSGKQFYAGIYIKNDSKNFIRRAIQLNANGGKVFLGRFGSSTYKFTENQKQLDSLISSGRINPSSQEYTDYLYDIKTSLTEQVKLEFHVPSTRDLIKFDSNGANISNLTYTNSVTVNDLLPNGDYQGIYLRLTTNFKTPLNVPLDYIYLNLRYDSYINSLGTIEQLYIEEFPGQLKSTNNNLYKADDRFLPSLVIKLLTNYGNITPQVDEMTQRIYSKYPSYFGTLEDSNDN